jgi:hypothetical protein
MVAQLIPVQYAELGEIIFIYKNINLINFKLTSEHYDGGQVSV